MRILKKAFVDTSSKEYFLASDILAIFTIVSIISLVLETVPSLADYGLYFTLIEWLAVAVFTAEYAARLMIMRPTYRYVFSFFGIIDLVSILPTYLGLGNFTFLKSARAIRLIRLLRMVRIAKIKRLNPRDIEERMSFFAINVALFLVTLVTMLLFIGTLIYLAEGNKEAFSSIPLGMLWSFKMFLLGLPIEYPETFFGQVVHILGRLVGLTVFGVLVGVAGNIVRNFLFEGKLELAL